MCGKTNKNKMHLMGVGNLLFLFLLDCVQGYLSTFGNNGHISFWRTQGKRVEFSVLNKGSGSKKRGCEIFMGRFDMETPYHPKGHACFEKVDGLMRPTLTSFIASQSGDPELALLFSSISSALKSISCLTR